MRVVVGGASGLIGAAVKKLLRADGVEVVQLVRKPSAGEGEIRWDPLADELAVSDLQGVDGAILLSGFNIAKKRWNEEVRQVILDSRVKSVGLLARSLAQLDARPKAFVCASAIGYYGDRGDEVCTEESAVGDIVGEFLPLVCKEWEAAAAPAVEAGIRTVSARIGPVLAVEGGMLKELLVPFRMGLGGRVGSGKQWLSWITLRDVAAALVYALKADSLKGPLNLVAPNPVTNRDFTKALGGALHRPTILPVPAFMIELLLGQMGVELPLSSTRVSSEKLEESGFKFKDPEIMGALRSLLGE
jgi:uncharacterized protein (TIGR01777 family)